MYDRAHSSLLQADVVFGRMDLKYVVRTSITAVTLSSSYCTAANLKYIVRLIVLSSSINKKNSAQQQSSAAIIDYNQRLTSDFSFQQDSSSIHRVRSISSRLTRYNDTRINEVSYAELEPLLSTAFSDDAALHLPSSLPFFCLVSFRHPAVRCGCSCF